MTDTLELRFGCDAMLGGLARWLRAAGYDASWQEGIADPQLIRLCQQEERVLLSSDSKLFDYRLLRDHHLPALFVPLRRSPQQQLAHVLAAWNLTLREPRCMSCGGRLLEVPKETLRDRVPARTFAWLDHFWECDHCRRIFWHGTHWERIRHQLHQAVSSPAAK